MVSKSFDDLRKRFLAKVGDDALMVKFLDVYLSSKTIGDDSRAQRFIVGDEKHNDSLREINEKYFLDLDLDNSGLVTYRLTIALLKKIGMDLALDMQEYLINKK